MVRPAILACLLLAACSPLPEESGQPPRGYAGTVQKVFRVVRTADDSAARLLGKLGNVLAPVLRQHQETHQYVVRTPGGQIVAQSDHEFSVGDCVRVIPEAASSGPAFRYGEARVVSCH